MKCVYCAYIGSRVVDSRLTEDGNSVRRRRECEQCGRRFTTFEKADTVPMMVVKKDKSLQPFQPDKIRAGIVKACEKRPVSLQSIDEIVLAIEKRAYRETEREIPSKRIGDMVMEALREVDDVAYVRYSCVYHQFRDLQTFVDELGRLIAEKQGSADESVREDIQIR